MPRTPGTGRGRSLFRPSSPSTTTTFPGPKSPAIWPGWWPRPSGQVGGGRPCLPPPQLRVSRFCFRPLVPPRPAPRLARRTGSGTRWGLGGGGRRGVTGLLFSQEPPVCAGGMRQISFIGEQKWVFVVFVFFSSLQ